MERGGVDFGEDFETTVEIKIKTLDSQTYSLRVNKYVPVPALKEQIATVTGVLSEQQRLICRGRVLKDDQLLSAYHVEDGHTLHLVVRQPHQSSPTVTGLEGQPANSSPDIVNNFNQVSRTVVLEAINIDQADIEPAFLNRIMTNILNSFGTTNSGSNNASANIRESNSFSENGVLNSQNQPNITFQSSQNQPNFTFQSSQNLTNNTSQRTESERQQSTFHLPTAVSSGMQNLPAIPHSLTTLNQYLDHLKNAIRREISGSNDRDHNSSGETSAAQHQGEGGDYFSPSHQSVRRDDLPSPAALAEVLQSTRQLLAEHVDERLLGLVRELDNNSNLIDHLMRSRVQSNAIRTGFFLQNLGSLLLELGRTTMTLRMGQMPSEAVVNAGPAVFISASGPNPVMVQPVPFYPAPSFGGMQMGTMNSGHAPEGERVGSTTLPRNIDIRIHAVPISASSQSGSGNAQLLSENTNSARTSENGDSIRAASIPEYGLRVVPVRTVVAIPAGISTSQSNLSLNLVPLLHPLISRIVQQNSANASDALHHQDNHIHESGVEAIHEPIPDSVRHILETYIGSVGRATSHAVPAVSGSILPTTTQLELQGTGSYLAGQHMPNGYDGSTSAHSDCDQNSNQRPPPQNPTALNQLVNTEQAIANRNANFNEASASETDQGMILSSILHQLMPLLTRDTVMPQDYSSIPSDSLISEAHNVDMSDPSSSRDQRGLPEPPSPKRQKRE